jgi:L(+)-tartrate dehydratase beta subunit
MTEIRDGKKIITTPITDEDIKGLRASEAFYLSGDILTGRDEVHARVVNEGMDFPADIEGKALFHAGPIVKDADTDSKDEAGSAKDAAGEGRKYELVSIGPTTSMRMEKFEKDFIRKTGVKMIIGKGGMGSDTAGACKEYGAVHCAAPAGCAVVGAVSVEEISDVSWFDLGMPEAVWHLKVREFGPLIVTIDAEGNNYFEEKKRAYNARKDEQIESIVRRL